MADNVCQQVNTTSEVFISDVLFTTINSFESSKFLHVTFFLGGGTPNIVPTEHGLLQILWNITFQNAVVHF